MTSAKPASLLPTIALGICTLLGAGVAKAADTLAAAMVNYSVAWGGTNLGEGTLQLTPEGRDCYVYQLKTRPIGVVRWVYGAPAETSRFCVVNNQVVVSSMEFSNPKREKDGFTLLFDFARGQVTGGRNGPLPIKPGTVDRLSVQQAARLWVKSNIGRANPGTWAVDVADHKRIKRYTFALKGRGQVDTPQGTMEAVRFERVDDANTTLRFWLAPDKDYMPIKVEHVEDGETKLRLSMQ